MLVTAVFLLFFLPLCPEVERLIQKALSPAAHRLELMLGNIAEAARPMSAPGVGSRPMSAGDRVKPAPAPSEENPGDRARRFSHLSQSTRLTRRSSRTIRRSSHSMNMPAPERPGEEGGMAPPVHRIRVQRPSRIMVFIDVIQEPVRVVIGFWQIVSSFSGNLYVPWPSIYYALANALSVVSLQFLQLPAISCVQPEVSFFTGTRARAQR
jgi:hypothetical protein